MENTITIVKKLNEIFNIIDYKDLNNRKLIYDVLSHFIEDLEPKKPYEEYSENEKFHYYIFIVIKKLNEILNIIDYNDLDNRELIYKVLTSFIVDLEPIKLDSNGSVIESDMESDDSDDASDDE